MWKVYWQREEKYKAKAFPHVPSYLKYQQITSDDIANISITNDGLLLFLYDAR
jgi:hypothetical protein